MKLKHLLLAGVAILGLGGIAASQVNVVPQVGVISGVIGERTYVASSVALVSPASATDIFCINGSTSRNIHIRRITIGGSGTAISTPILINYNHSLDTGGTAATGSAAPVAVPLSPTDPASTSAAQIAYTAVPTINDSTPSLLAVGTLSLAAASAAGSGTTTFYFGPGPGSGITLDKSIDIPKASTVVAQVCLNLNTTSITSPKLNITAE